MKAAIGVANMRQTAVKNTATLCHFQNTIYAKVYLEPC